MSDDADLERQLRSWMQRFGGDEPDPRRGLRTALAQMDRYEQQRMGRWPIAVVAAIASAIAIALVVLLAPQDRPPAASEGPEPSTTPSPAAGAALHLTYAPASDPAPTYGTDGDTWRGYLVRLCVAEDSGHSLTYVGADARLEIASGGSQAPRNGRGHGATPQAPAWARDQALWIDKASLEPGSCVDGYLVFWTDADAEPTTLEWHGQRLPVPSSQTGDPTGDPGSWRAISAAPLAPRYGHAAVWTGLEMVVWGGNAVVHLRDPAAIQPASDGAAYDPHDDSWSLIAEAPIPSAGLLSSHAVWTGEEMLVRSGLAMAAYDPATERWRDLPRLPLQQAAGGVWTGSELVVFAACSPQSGPIGVALDPSSETWRALPPPPLPVNCDASGAWTGSELVVSVTVGGEPRMQAAAYDPEADSWRDIEGEPDIGGGVSIWTGREVVFVNPGGGNAQPGRTFTAAERPTADSAAYDPASGDWRILAVSPPNCGWGDPVWTGNEIIGYRFDALAYSPEQDRWRTPPVVAADDANRLRDFSSLVWTGDELLVWGGRFAGEALGAYNDGFAYQPGDTDAASQPTTCWPEAPEPPDLGP